MDIVEVQSAIAMSGMPKEVTAVIWQQTSGEEYTRKAIEAVRKCQ